MEENKKREQGKEWCCVLQYDIHETNEQVKHEQILNACNELCFIYYAFILHDKFSIVEKEEQEKTLHYHLVLKSEKILDKNSVLNMLTEGLGVPKETISVQKCSSLKQQVRYLVHKDQAEKYQFDTSDIITNDIEQTTEFLSDFLQPTTTLINNWLASGANRGELFALIGLKNYQAINGVVNSLTSTYALEHRVRHLETLNDNLIKEVERLRALCVENDICPDILPFDLKMFENSEK